MTTTKHIHSAFDDDLQQLTILIMTMGGLVEEAIAHAVKALRDRDDTKAESVILADRRIDELAEEISSESVKIIALRQPQAMDLRTVIATMKISISMERVGDYAKNIAKRTQVLNTQMPDYPGKSGSVKRLGKAIRIQIKDSLDAFINQNAEQAHELIQRDEDIDQMYNALFREYLTHMMEDPRSITTAMHYLFIAKNLERMGDHVTSIAEQIVYLVTGTVPLDDRSKNVMLSFESIVQQDDKKP